MSKAQLDQLAAWKRQAAIGGEKIPRAHIQTKTSKYEHPTQQR